MPLRPDRETRRRAPRAPAVQELGQVDVLEIRYPPDSRDEARLVVKRRRKERNIRPQSAQGPRERRRKPVAGGGPRGPPAPRGGSRRRADANGCGNRRVGPRLGHDRDELGSLLVANRRERMHEHPEMPVGRRPSRRRRMNERNPPRYGDAHAAARCQAETQRSSPVSSASGCQSGSRDCRREMSAHQRAGSPGCGRPRTSIAFVDPTRPATVLPSRRRRLPPGRDVQHAPEQPAAPYRDLGD